MINLQRELQLLLAVGPAFVGLLSDLQHLAATALLLQAPLASARSWYCSRDRVVAALPPSSMHQIDG